MFDARKAANSNARGVCLVSKINEHFEPVPDSEVFTKNFSWPLARKLIRLSRHFHATADAFRCREPRSLASMIARLMTMTRTICTTITSLGN